MTDPRAQASVGWIVGPFAEHAVAVLLLDELAIGVVLRILQDLRDVCLHLQVHLPELPGKTIARGSAMAAGVGLFKHGAKRTEHLMAGERLVIIKCALFHQCLSGEGIAGDIQRA